MQGYRAMKLLFMQGYRDEVIMLLLMQGYRAMKLLFMQGYRDEVIYHTKSCKNGNSDLQKKTDG